MNGGFIKIHRKMLKWEWYDDHCTKVVFLHLLLSARFKETRWRGIVVGRGQFLTSRRKLARDLKLGEQQIRTAILRLESTHEITVKSTHDHTLITICKYEDYQQNNISSNPQDNPQDNPQLTQSQPTTNPPLTHITEEVKKLEEVKKDKKEYPPTPQGESEPSKRFFKPCLEEVKAYMIEISLPTEEGDSFCDYYTSNGWKVGKNAMKDWRAAARNWKKNYKKNNAKSGIYPGSESAERLKRDYARKAEQGRN